MEEEEVKQRPGHRALLLFTGCQTPCSLFLFLPTLKDVLSPGLCSDSPILLSPFQVLCLSPTYELALQTGEVASKMSQFAPELTIRYAVKGEEIPRGSKITDHIIIGTPGKVRQQLLRYDPKNMFWSSPLFDP